MKVEESQIVRDPEKNFEELWGTFHNRYPFFVVRNVDWKRQYDIYRPRISSVTGDDQLFDVFCQMLDHWRCCLSYQKYFSAGMVCYEGKGVPVDIEMLNKQADIEDSVDPLILRALQVLKSHDGCQMGAT